MNFKAIGELSGKKSLWEDLGKTSVSYSIKLLNSLE
jgi:hypothetical protein